MKYFYEIYTMQRGSSCYINAYIFKKQSFFSEKEHLADHRFESSDMAEMVGAALDWAEREVEKRRKSWEEYRIEEKEMKKILKDKKLHIAAKFHSRLKRIKI